MISAPEQHTALEASWARYMDFERYASADPQRLVQAEGALPDRLLEMMPEVQYLAGEFQAALRSQRRSRCERGPRPGLCRNLRDFRIVRPGDMRR